jgi:hypothetical protein
MQALTTVQVLDQVVQVSVIFLIAFLATSSAVAPEAVVDNVYIAAQIYAMTWS